ncbi:hypothetical protein SCAR479_04892 [Seiridium cardinale]|uniref:Uncharacterized protein n=1 Tax=Seiridium cardinale TaxID=138064 RepID=A0ABR2Y4M1_9PEZI
MAQHCEIQGDADLIGLGVRLGSYLQWLALILAGIAAPKEIDETANAIGLFQFAFLIAFITTIAANLGDTYDVVAYIMTVFGAGGGLTIAAIYYNKGGTHLAAAFSYSLALGFSASALWLWSWGLNVLVSLSYVLNRHSLIGLIFEGPVPVFKDFHVFPT